jgi:hypothetical protein
METLKEDSRLIKLSERIKALKKEINIDTIYDIILSGHDLYKFNDGLPYKCIKNCIKKTLEEEKGSNIIDFLREEYGNYWGQRFWTVDDFKKMLTKDNVGFYVEKIWNIQEYPNITLVQIRDEHRSLWNEIVIIEGIYEEKEFNLFMDL